MTALVGANAAALGYLVAATMFILSIRGLANPETARRGLRLGVVGMVLAFAITLFVVRNALDQPTVLNIGVAILLGSSLGALLAFTTRMTAMPQMVSILNGLGGLASFLTALAAAFAPAAFGLQDESGAVAMRSAIEIGLSVIIGAITFSGSAVAALKLRGSLAMLLLPSRHFINILLLVLVLVATGLFAVTGAMPALLAAAGIALLLGVLLVIPIGGADMPVVVSILNSYSGWAAAALGLTLANFALIVVGAIVGASGSILSYIMCKAMNRSFVGVISGGFGSESGAGGAQEASAPDRPVRRGAAEDAAFIMKNATKVIIVPGYGMAVAQAQHAIREMADELKARGIDVSYAIHPVAGRMPGHMNVLLAEAQVPYDDIFTMEEINPSFKQADVAFVIGANDVTNPAARDDSSSPIFGMPVLEVWNARAVMIVKRSLGTGYSGVGNDLFYRENTMMLLGDGRKMAESIVRAL